MTEVVMLIVAAGLPAELTSALAAQLQQRGVKQLSLRISPQVPQSAETSAVSIQGTVASAADDARQVIQRLEILGYLPPEAAEDYSAEEEEMVRKRLEDLGYL